ncbi:MAG: hypothetical protein IPP19_13115 [Verrucomicrobia bacterium]|nr:hypothetical protein [Verrucomicrobiota bacterium]
MPKGLPRDPLPDTGESQPPLKVSSLLAALCLPVAALLAFWLWLALRRARGNRSIASTPRNSRPPLPLQSKYFVPPRISSQIAALCSPGKDTAILYQITPAALTASDFTGRRCPTPHRQPVVRPLADTERALYRDATPLP